MPHIGNRIIFSYNQKTIEMEGKEISADALKRKGNQPCDLTNDCGEPTVFDARSELYIQYITLDKDGNPCALIPLGYLEDETIREIAKMMHQ